MEARRPWAVGVGRVALLLVFGDRMAEKKTARRKQNGAAGNVHAPERGPERGAECRAQCTGQVPEQVADQVAEQSALSKVRSRVRGPGRGAE
jgi:hypothetical protein